MSLIRTTARTALLLALLAAPAAGQGRDLERTWDRVSRQEIARNDRESRERIAGMIAAGVAVAGIAVGVGIYKAREEGGDA